MNLPNLLTILRILLTPVIIYLFLSPTENSLIAALIVFMVASFTDWYDGYHARKYNVITRWGQFMDPLADKIFISGILLAFWMKGYVFGWVIWSIIIRDFVITAMRSYALWKGSPVVTSQLAKLKTFLQMLAVFILLIHINLIDSYINGELVYGANYQDIPGIFFTLAAISTIASGLQYIFENKSLFPMIFRDIFR